MATLICQDAQTAFGHAASPQTPKSYVCFRLFHNPGIPISDEARRLPRDGSGQAAAGPAALHGSTVAKPLLR